MTHPGRMIPILSLAAGCMALATTASAQTTGQMPARLKKQIDVMEKVIDEVLIDSKNFLVPRHEPTRGVFLPEFGVLFTFDASILSPDRGEWWKDMGKKFRVETDKNGTTVVHLNDDDDDDDDSDKDSQKKKEERELTRKEIMKDREQRYENGKKELVGVLLDYGYTLSGLRDDQSVALVAYIEDDNGMFDMESEDQTVILRAKMGDLRAHESGKLSDEATKSRITIEEY